MNQADHCFTGTIIINGSYHGERIRIHIESGFQGHAATDKSGSGKAVF